MMAHTCHATDCKVAAAPEMFMCKRHWFMLPDSLRSEIWRTYHEYAEAARNAVIYIARKEGKTPDTMLDPKVTDE